MEILVTWISVNGVDEEGSAESKYSLVLSSYFSFVYCASFDIASLTSFSSPPPHIITMFKPLPFMGFCLASSSVFSSNLCHL